jgi:hypothetical protein
MCGIALQMGKLKNRNYRFQDFLLTFMNLGLNPHSKQKNPARISGSISSIRQSRCIMHSIIDFCDLKENGKEIACKFK